MKVFKSERPWLQLQLGIRNNLSKDCQEVENQKENPRCIIIDLNADNESEFEVSPFFIDLTMGDIKD
tara:strand:- start:656 stop:856 length:201 start_codon:yes stop_codon:yes gene_type:complete